ncbi:hypothetical protein DVH24_018140 [Malus domestica]|uniref:Uncharacterized protein n=1 Tax=Malus domestica TaxID=3750 RepID=A0A498KEQ7_MALDO|nr:hypothetical protein DVH24_018140 [Malus domestica]
MTTETGQIGSLKSGETVFVNGNNSQIGNMTSLIMPAATLGVVGYGYTWWKLMTKISFCHHMFHLIVICCSSKKKLLTLNRKLMHQE